MLVAESIKLDVLPPTTCICSFCQMASGGGGAGSSSSGSAAGGFQLKFRNYRPADATLQAAAAEVVKPADAPSIALQKAIAAGGGVLPTPAPAAAGASSAGPAPPEAAAAGAGTGGSSTTGEDSLVIAPRKPNWDLKRDFAGKQAILDRQTDRAIAELVRRKVAEAAAAAKASGAGAAAGAAGGEALTDEAIRAMETVAESAGTWGGAEDIDI